MTIIETLREEIRICKKSGIRRSQISRETGIDQAALYRILNGGSCKVETVEKLCKYFGFELKSKKKKAK